MRYTYASRLYWFVKTGMERHEILFFFFNDTATTEIYTLSLHDALPISPRRTFSPRCAARANGSAHGSRSWRPARSEEHTSELQSHVNLVCRLLLEKKKNKLLNFVLIKKKKTNNF